MSDKLWYIKTVSGAAFLFKGGKRVPNFKNIVGTEVIEQPIASTSASSNPAAKKLLKVSYNRVSRYDRRLCKVSDVNSYLFQLEFTPSANNRFQFASLNPRYFNRFDCDGELKKIQGSTAESLAEKIGQILEELNAEEPTAPISPEPEASPQQFPATPDQVREKRPLTPLFSSSKKKKTESSHVKGIQERCSKCLVDSKWFVKTCFNYFNI